MPYINSSRVTHYQAKAVIWVVIHLTFLKAEESGVRSQELGVRSQNLLVLLVLLVFYSPWVNSGVDSPFSSSISGASVSSDKGDSASS